MKIWQKIIELITSFFGYLTAGKVEDVAENIKDTVEIVTDTAKDIAEMTEPKRVRRKHSFRDQFTKSLFNKQRKKRHESDKKLF